MQNRASDETTTPRQNRVFLLGQPAGAPVRDAVESLASASVQVEFVSSLEDVITAAVEERPLAILLDARAKGASQACLALRMHPTLSLAPIIWLADEVDDLTFAEAFGVGGDDVARTSAHDGLLRRLRGLPPIEDDSPRAIRGIAVLVEANDQRRIVLASLFRSARFDVSFAMTAAELAERVASDAPALVVADWDLTGGDTLKVLEDSRASGAQAPWIFASTPKKLRDATLALKGVDRTWVWDAFSPPENILYVANDALSNTRFEQRATPRLLYGTIVAFRVAGRERDDLGYLYNVSADGLFVRTLAPMAPGDDAWLEFKPPRTDRCIRVEAAVVWRKCFGRVSEATVPPGFGVRITGGSVTDVKRYRDGYQALAEQFVDFASAGYPSIVPRVG